MLIFSPAKVASDTCQHSGSIYVIIEQEAAFQRHFNMEIGDFSFEFQFQIVSVIIRVVPVRSVANDKATTDDAETSRIFTDRTGVGFTVTLSPETMPWQSGHHFQARASSHYH
jgi:hypothetical protein